MIRYIHQQRNWPVFRYDLDAIAGLLAQVRFEQGMLLGSLRHTGINEQQEASLETLAAGLVKSAAIEGEQFNLEEARSSFARHLGIRTALPVSTDRKIDGMAEMMLEATNNYQKPLSRKRLCAWQAALFPEGNSGLNKITTGKYRTSASGPLQVVSGVYGKRTVHFEAPEAGRIESEMVLFLSWFNEKKDNTDPFLKAAVAHLWFLTIHPFEDGNGRIARVLTDLIFCRADHSALRFYSLSTEIMRRRKDYYAMLEASQKGTLNCTEWVAWFLHCALQSLRHSGQLLQDVFARKRFFEAHRHTALNERQKTMLARLTQHFDGKLTTAKWAKLSKCSDDSALRDIQDLMRKNILTKDSGGGRSASYSLIME